MATDRGSATAVLPALLDAGLITPFDVVERGVSTVTMSRSNHVAVVAVGGRRRYVAKVGRSDALRWQQGDPAVERRLLTALAQHKRSWLPEVVLTSGDLLVTSVVGTGASLRDQVPRGEVPPVAAARVVGAALGAMCAAADPPSELPARRPWVLRLAERPWPAFVAEHEPAVALIDRVLNTAVAEALGMAARSWRTEALMHGDVRWDNCVLNPAGAVLIDWEFAGAGDPVWDLACALAEHLAWGPLGPQACAELTADPAEAAARAVHAVAAEWAALVSAYLATGAARARGVVTRVPVWVAVRVFQIAVQWTYWSPDDPTRARWLANVASALLADPPEVTMTEGL